VPRWAEGFVPPRYRRANRIARAEQGAEVPAEPVAAGAAPSDPEMAAPEPVGSGMNGGASGGASGGVNGATAIGDRSRFTHRRRIGSPQ
ncbi:undecaprenyl/decaprenyl-phosphate alpha-N-acetylglucosaminyl 1-phosphate transferase, partial [Streptomyces antimycoticus]